MNHEDANQNFRKKLHQRWKDMEVEEKTQESRYFDHYIFKKRDNKMKDLAFTFFLDYYKNSNPLISYFSWQKINTITRMIKQSYDPVRHKILDVGCGCAFLFEQLGWGEHQYGIDVSSMFIDAARKNVPWGTYIHANAKNIPFDDGFFDFVVCNDVLEHAFYPVKLLHEIDRVVKQDKMRVYITIPNEFNCRIGRLISLRLPVKWPFHINSLTPHFLSSNFPRCPVDIVSFPFNHVPWYLSLEQLFIF